MKPRRLLSETMVSRSRTAGATSFGSTVGVVTSRGSPLIRDRGRAARDGLSPDASRSGQDLGQDAQGVAAHDGADGGLVEAGSQQRVGDERHPGGVERDG